MRVQRRGLPSVKKKLPAELTKAEALQVESWVILQLQAGVAKDKLDYTPTDTGRPAPKPQGMTVNEAYDKACTLYWEKQRGWKDYYCSIGGIAVELFGADKVMATVTKGDIIDMVQKCEERGDAPQTICHRLNILQRLWNYAVDDWEVPGVKPLPWSKYKPRVPKGRIREITKAEEAKLYEFFEARIETRKWARTARELTECGILLGLRLGEFLALRPEDILEEENVVYVHQSNDNDETKGGELRCVPLIGRARSILLKRKVETLKEIAEAKLQRRKRPGGKRIFGTCTKYSIRDLWQEAREEMGLQEDKDFVFHATRHTCATRLLRNGEDIRLVQEWLGHSDITTTQRYAHVATQDLQEAGKRLVGSI